MTDYELIFFAAVAIFFAYKLWSVLGKTNGQEQARAAEVTASAEKQRNAAMPSKTLDLKAEKIEPQEAVPAHLDEAVKKIKAVDKSFTLQGFKKYSEDVFEAVIKNFNHHNSGELKKQLSPEVLAGFESEIQGRESRGEKQSSTLISMAEPYVLGAELNGNIAHIVVKFLSEQVHMVRGKTGDIIEGAANAIDHVTDIWTFERDLAAKKSGWLVAGIQGE